MQLKKEWNNWQIFLASIILTSVFAWFVAPSYFDVFPYSGGWFASDVVDMAESYILSFLLLYTFFITFFYRAFSKSFKPVALIYFVVLPLLFFFSSLPHLITFLILLILGWIFGKAVRGMLLSIPA